VRSKRNTVAIKTFFLDFDVKPGAYATTAEALAAFESFRGALGLPKRTFVVYSSPEDDSSAPCRSGFHVHWVLTRALSVEEWLPIARALSTAARAHGLLLDFNVITNACCLLRMPGSRNFKHDPPRVSREDPDVGNDHDPDVFRARLAPYMRQAEPVARDPDLAAHTDFDALFDAVKHLHARGRYGPGHYDEMLELIFGLAHLVTAGPDLHSHAVDLLHRVVARNGRDPEINNHRWADAMTRTNDRLAANEPVSTPASIFKRAIDEGWSRANSLDTDQEDALYRAQRRLHQIFDSDDYDHDDAARKAERLAARVRDPGVRAALAPTMARCLARDGRDESTILNAIELLTGQRNIGLARWARRRLAL
jgi:hypothetical protein